MITTRPVQVDVPQETHEALARFRSRLRMNNAEVVALAVSILEAVTSILPREGEKQAPCHSKEFDIRLLKSPVVASAWKIFAATFWHPTDLPAAVAKLDEFITKEAGPSAIAPRPIRFFQVATARDSNPLNSRPQAERISGIETLECFEGHDFDCDGRYVIMVDVCLLENVMPLGYTIR